MFRLRFAVALAVLTALAAALSGQQAPPGVPLTLLSREGRRPIPTLGTGEQELVALDELATLFQLTVREESLGGLTVSARGRTLVLSPDQALASVNGRVIALSAPPTRVGRRWAVPLDFIGRALPQLLDTRVELRKASRLVILGDLKVPRVAARHELAGNQARITLDIAPRFGTTVVQESQRLLVKMDADALDASLPAFAPGEVVQALRVVEPGSIAIDLGPRFASFRATTLPGDAASARIVLDLLGAQETTPAPAPSAAPAPAPAPGTTAGTIGGADPTSGGGTARTLVIDPGHGGDDDGVKTTGGAREKEITLGVARRLKALVESRLGQRVVLTREDDRRIGLDERAALANNNKADLFLSLHVNAAPRPSVSGASISYLEAPVSADGALGGGVGLPVFGGGTRAIELIPWAQAQMRHIDRSAALAHLIETQFQGRVPLSPRPVQQAPFRVLSGANMPAVLVEMGYLTNAGQEAALRSAEFQGALAQALFDAIGRFRDGAAAISPATPARPGDPAGRSQP